MSVEEPTRQLSDGTTVDESFDALARDFDNHALVAQGYAAEQVAYAVAMLELYRSLRVLEMMDQSGHHQWLEMNRDEVGWFIDDTAKVLGLTPGEEASDKAVHSFIAFRLETLNRMPYDEYLQTPEWKDVRRFALHRAGNRCQNCNARGRLHVHHRTYERRGHEDLSDVIVLCADCHRAFHENRRLAR
jgi:hypothetical protein